MSPWIFQRWWLFDATRQAHLDGLVRIGIGRDATEVAFSTPFGTFEPKAMEIRIARSEGVIHPAVSRCREALVARVVGPVEAPALGVDLPLDIRGTAFQQCVLSGKHADTHPQIGRVSFGQERRVSFAPHHRAE